MKAIRKLPPLLFCIVLVASLMGSAPSPAAARLHPSLAGLLAQSPGSQVAVIVQKSARSDRPEQLVRAAGGRVTHDFSMINGFAARLPAAGLAALAACPEVRWVSPDGPVQKSTLQTGNLADNFNTAAYTNSTGSVAWPGPWVEYGDDGKVGGGSVRVASGLLMLTGTNRGVKRPVDLTMADQGLLSFQYKRASFPSTAVMRLEISINNGSTWSTLAAVSGSGSDSTLKTSLVDLSPYLRSSAVLRFAASGLGAGKVYVDNVNLDLTWDDGMVELPPLPGPDVALNYSVQDDLYVFPQTFKNNTGTRNWTSAWKEIGETDGHTAGHVRITSDQYWDRILIQETNSGTWVPMHGIWRSTNLSSATTAVLSFTYRRSSMEGADYVALELSNNLGASWQEAARFTAGSDSEYQTAEFNISPFISIATAIRFISNFASGDSVDSFYLDDVSIRFDPQPMAAPDNTFLDTLNVHPLWDMGLKGSGIGVAVIDSGMSPDWDFQRLPDEPGYTSSRLFTQVSFNDNSNLAYDSYGHGTHVAGIIGGSGQKSNGHYMGVAPNVGFVSLKVADDYGQANESDVVAAMQWVFDHGKEQAYHIRIVNLSLNSTVESSYHQSPLNAAVEVLWFNGYVVVASAGNSTASSTYNPIKAAPANDPFIITVGASDENYTTDRADDSIASFSAYGVTLDGFSKPDVIAPGRNIIATLASTSWWRNEYLPRFVDGIYFRASGTSMAAPMVTGTVALMLQNDPDLTPDQVKYRLTHTGSTINGAQGDPQSYPYLSAYDAVMGSTTESANTGLTVCNLLTTGTDPVNSSVAWNSVAWNSVAWNSVAWNSVAWNSVAWNSVAWNSVDFNN